MLWHETGKRFFGIAYFEGILNDLHLAPAWFVLRDLQLDFHLEAWFDFFGVDIPGIYKGLSRGAAARLAELSSLRSLVMFFRSTKNALKCGRWVESVDGDRQAPSTFCQRIGVDIALSFGFQYVKDIKEVHIGGFVKDGTMLKWNMIFHEYKLGIPPDIDPAQLQVAWTIAP